MACSGAFPSSRQSPAWARSEGWPKDLIYGYTTNTIKAANSSYVISAQYAGRYARILGTDICCEPLLYFYVPCNRRKCRARFNLGARMISVNFCWKVLC